MKALGLIALFFGVSFAILVFFGFMAKLYWSVFMIGWGLL